MTSIFNGTFHGAVSSTGNSIELLIKGDLECKGVCLIIAVPREAIKFHLYSVKVHLCSVPKGGVEMVAPILIIINASVRRESTQL